MGRDKMLYPDKNERNALDLGYAKFFQNVTGYFRKIFEPKNFPLPTTLFLEKNSVFTCVSGQGHDFNPNV